ILGAMLLIARPRLRATEILLIAAWGYLALHSVRNVPIFALVITPVLAAYLDKFLREPHEGAWSHLYRKVSADITGLNHAARGHVPVAIVVAALIVVIGKPGWLGISPVLSTELLPDRFPVAAVKSFLTKRHTNLVLHGEMFNDYGWGGYLMLTLPERRVFIDGRNDFYGRDLVEEFNAVDEVKPQWEQVLAR